MSDFNNTKSNNNDEMNEAKSNSMNNYNISVSSNQAQNSKKNRNIK